MKDYWLSLILLTTFVMSSNKTLSVGHQAPDFTLPDQDGNLHTLSDYLGQKVVVYFYPKDNTPGCTKEACNFRDNYFMFSEKNIQVFGISYDSEKSHQKFREKYELPLTLLSDRDKSVSALYGTKGWFMPKRKTFLINEEGIIEKIYEQVTVTSHGEDILNFFMQDNDK